MDSGLAIAMGQLIDCTSIHKFGRNDGLSTAGYESIWTQGGLYPWEEFDAGAAQLYAISSDSDVGTLEIQGLDANFLPLTSTVTLTGTSQVALPVLFTRVFRLRYTGGVNAGKVTLHTVSGTGVVVAAIEIGLGQSQMLVYTVPANSRGYMTTYTIGARKGDDANIQIRVREPDFPSFLMKSEIAVYQTTHLHNFTVPLLFPPKTDIDFIAITSSANSQVIANFDLILDKFK